MLAAKCSDARMRDEVELRHSKHFVLMRSFFLAQKRISFRNIFLMFRIAARLACVVARINQMSEKERLNAERRRSRRHRHSTNDDRRKQRKQRVLNGNSVFDLFEMSNTLRPDVKFSGSREQLGNLNAGLCCFVCVGNATILRRCTANPPPPPTPTQLRRSFVRKRTSSLSRFCTNVRLPKASC